MKWPNLKKKMSLLAWKKDDILNLGYFQFFEAENSQTWQIWACQTTLMDGLDPKHIPIHIFY
jgi:hypothetical protein